MSLVKFKLGIVKINEELIRTMAKAIKGLVEFEWYDVDEDYLISLLVHCNGFHDSSIVQWSNLFISLFLHVITYGFKMMIVILQIEIHKLNYFGSNAILVGARFNDRQNEVKVINGWFIIL